MYLLRMFFLEVLYNIGRAIRRSIIYYQDMVIARKRQYFQNDLTDILLFVVGGYDYKFVQEGTKLKSTKIMNYAEGNVKCLSLTLISAISYG